MFILVLQRLFFEALLDALYFPIWWYTGGIKYAAGGLFGLFNRGNQTLAPGLWLKNIFVPMFGQYDWQGRMISFFMRSVQVFFRSLALLLWAVVCLVLFFFWLVFPIIVIYGLVSAVRH